MGCVAGRLVMGCDRGKHSEQSYGYHVDLSCSLLHFWVSRNLVTFPFPITESDTPVQMEISLINANVSYTRVISAQFSELRLCLQPLKTNQLKIIVMPKRHILEGQILLSFSSYPSAFPNYFSLCGGPFPWAIQPGTFTF